MARNSAIKTVNSFNKGLITEATGLNFPDNAVTDALNVIFDETAKMTRRKGFAFETGATSFSATVETDTVIKEYVWKNAGGRANVNLVCLQVGSTIHFYRTSSTGALSANKASFTIDLNTYKVSGSPTIADVEVSFAAGYNYLFIAHPYCDPIYVKYNSSTSITVSRVTVKIRDFEGVDDGLDTDETPNTLSRLHKYNLYNQGWYKDTVLVDSGGGTGGQNPVTKYKERVGKYPSNAEQWWIYKRSTGTFDPGEVSVSIGNTEAPRGHYIVKAFYVDRSTVSGITGLDVVTSSYFRPSNVAFFAGRVFYAGTNYAKYTNKIYFSQIIQKDEQIGRCYQANDPTSEDTPDLLPSDGGEVLIPDMGTVYKMVPIQSNLVVFASNGVWSVGGTEGTGGFKANDYSIKKISNVGTISQSSFADIEGSAIWWSLDSIWTITVNNIGNLEVTSVTDASIKTYYQAIPNDSKKTAKAVYNEKSKVIQWLYKSDASGHKYIYDKALNFNTLAQSFYPLSLPYTTNFIAGVVSITGNGVSSVEEVIETNAGDDVTDTFLSDVTVETETNTKLSSVFKYVTLTNSSGSVYSISFSESSSDSYYDFAADDYESYAVTGYSVDGKGVLYLQSNYVVVYMNEETNASCYLQGLYNWANTSSSGKYSSVQQAYRSSQLGHGVRQSRLKVRGKGRAIQLKFTSESGKPFTVIGWSLVETANATP